MKIHYALALAIATGLGLGAVAIRGLHAQTKPAPVYVVMEINEITDAHGFKALIKTRPNRSVEVRSISSINGNN